MTVRSVVDPTVLPVARPVVGPDFAPPQQIQVENMVTFNGQPVTFNGQTVTYTVEE